MSYFDGEQIMRVGLFVMGLILLFAGLTLSAISRNAVTIEGEDLQKIVEGVRDVPEVSNVNLTKGERFVAKYSGGGRYVDPNEVVVNVYDPYGNITTGIPYQTQFQEGILANYTGSYRIQVGAPGLVDPAYPLLIVIYRMVATSRIEYPNSNLLPYALASIMVGAGICSFGVISRQKPKRRLTKAAR